MCVPANLNSEPNSAPNNGLQGSVADIPSTNQDSSSWHQEISQELRTYLQRKMLAVFQPPSTGDQNAAQTAEPTSNRLIEIAKKAEKNLHEVAKSKEDYFLQIAKWIHMLQMNLDEKQKIEQEEQVNQQQSNAIGPEISKKATKKLRHRRKRQLEQNTKSISQDVTCELQEHDLIKLGTTFYDLNAPAEKIVAGAYFNAGEVKEEDVKTKNVKADDQQREDEQGEDLQPQNFDGVA